MDKENGSGYTIPLDGTEHHKAVRTEVSSALDGFDPKHESFLTPAARKLKFFQELNTFMENQKKHHANSRIPHPPKNKTPNL